MDCLGTQERVSNSRGKRAFSIRATEVLLYIFKVSWYIAMLLRHFTKEWWGWREHTCVTSSLLP